MGMSDIIGPRAISDPQSMQAGEGDLLRDKADQEIDRILNEQYDRGMTLLTENRDILDALAKTLIESEKIDGIELLQLIKSIRPNLIEDSSIDEMKEVMKPQLEAYEKEKAMKEKEEQEASK